MFSKTAGFDDLSTEMLLRKDYKDSDIYDPVLSRNLLLKWKLLATYSTTILFLHLIFTSFWSTLPVTLGQPKTFVYSPAQDFISHEIVVFKSNFYDDRTIYQGPPTDATDTACAALYNDIALSQIDKESAGRLPNRTAPIPGDEKYYIVGLDIFHQLHCLNHVRKSLYPSRYHLHENLSDKEMASAMEHLEHCIDSIRQSLMCSADTSTIYWSWDAQRQAMVPNAKTTHLCRNFSRIQEWAQEHRIGPTWDPFVRVEEQGGA